MPCIGFYLKADLQEMSSIYIKLFLLLSLVIFNLCVNLTETWGEQIFG